MQDKALGFFRASGFWFGRVGRDPKDIELLWEEDMSAFAPAYKVLLQYVTADAAKAAFLEGLKDGFSDYLAEEVLMLPYRKGSK